MSDEPEMTNVGNIYEMDYWCEPGDIFKYLDSVSPQGSKFKCAVCSGDQWGSSTVEGSKPGAPTKNVVTPCAFPVSLPDGSTMKIQGREYPNFHYSLVCLTCAHTVFFNAAMVQAKIKGRLVKTDGK
ncbi:hypothetical protein HKD51_21195 [Pseudomonas fragi]|nr:hypothetical protein [Pseudomonas sp. GC01]